MVLQLSGKFGIYNTKVNVDACMCILTYVVAFLSGHDLPYRLCFEYMRSAFISGLELVSLDYFYLLYDRKT